MTNRGERETWWFNIETRQVERHDEGARNAVRLGPYATREDAELALERAAARTLAWDAQDDEDEEWGGEG